MGILRGDTFCSHLLNTFICAFKMNESRAKKLRQMYKRDLRAKLAAVYFFSVIKRKPKWYPKFIWRLGAKFYFKKGVVDKHFS